MNLALIAATGFLLDCGGPVQTISSDVVVLLNSNSSHVKSGTQKLLPYLDHFGITYTIADLADGLPSNSGNPALVIVSHPGIDGNDKTLAGKLEQYLGKHLETGTGIVSFDPLIPSTLLSDQGNEAGVDPDVGELVYSRTEHYITAYHQPGEVQDLFGYMAIPELTAVNAEVLLTGNSHPLLVISDKGNGKKKYHFGDKKKKKFQKMMSRACAALNDLDFSSDDSSSSRRMSGPSARRVT